MRIRYIRGACKAHKAHKVMGKISGFYVNEVVQFH